MSVSFVARKPGISPSLLFNWRRRMAEGGREAVRVDDEVIGAARVRQLEERIRELDAELLARIRPLVDARPSHGYRRVTTLLNR
jgi:transposase-like protein